MMRLALIAIVGLATACGNMPSREFIGSIEVDGPNGYLNGQPARSGQRVYDGDTVATGAQTGLKVRLATGGYLQLDENTDPRLFRDGACIVVELLRGQTLVEAKRLCLRDENISLLTNSRVSWTLLRGETVVTVIEGSVEVSRPKVATIEQNGQWVVAGGAVKREARLSPAAANATADWARRYFDTGWCCDAGRVEQRSSNDCRARQAKFFIDQQQARKACNVTPPVPPPPPPTVGWCCSGGKVLEVNAKECASLNGRSFKDQLSAQKACTAAPPAPVGWCCMKSGLAQLDSQSCAKRSGKFYTDEKRARQSCPVIQ